MRGITLLAIWNQSSVHFGVTYKDYGRCQVPTVGGNKRQYLSVSANRRGLGARNARGRSPVEVTHPWPRIGSHHCQRAGDQMDVWQETSSSCESPGLEDCFENGENRMTTTNVQAPISSLGAPCSRGVTAIDSIMVHGRCMGRIRLSGMYSDKNLPHYHVTLTAPSRDQADRTPKREGTPREYQ